MFVVHATDFVRDGSSPTLLTGYGGFNNSMTPGFSTLATTWLESGGVFAVANLRGGENSERRGTGPECWRASRTSSTTSSARQSF